MDKISIKRNAAIAFMVIYLAFSCVAGDLGYMWNEIDSEDLMRSDWVDRFMTLFFTISTFSLLCALEHGFNKGYIE